MLRSALILFLFIIYWRFAIYLDLIHVENPVFTELLLTATLVVVWVAERIWRAMKLDDSRS